jgi:hypothetical protein
VRVTRVTAVVVFLIYVFLWVLALNGVSSLVPVLAIPLVLAFLVAFGVWLNRFMGITPRKQHFQDLEDFNGSDNHETSGETQFESDASAEVAPPDDAPEDGS